VRIPAAVWILAAAVASHWFDVRFHYLETEDFIRLFPSSPGTAFPSTVFRPMHDVFCLLARRLFDVSPAGIQWAKVLLIWAASTGVWAAGRRLGLSARWALFSGLLYAAHPLHSGVMLNLLHVDDLLLSGFGLGAFAAYLRARETSHAGWTLLCCAALLGALLSKETAVVLPLLFIAFDRAWVRAGEGAGISIRRYVPLLATVAVYALLAASFSGSRYGGWVLFPESPAAPLVRLLRYLPLFGDPFAARPPAAAAVLASVVVLAVLLRVFPGGWRVRAFVGGWLILPLLPVSGFVTTERLRGYLASLPHPSWHLALSGAAAAWLAAAALERAQARAGPRAAVLAAGILLAGGAAAASLHAASRRREFANEVVDKAFLEEGYRFSGGRFDSVMMSLPLIRREDPATFDAIGSAVRSAAGTSGPWITDLFAEASIYEDIERPYRLLEALSHKGIRRFHEQLAASPDGFAGDIVSAARLQDRGVALFGEGHEAGAESSFRAALRLNPENLFAKLSLATVLAKAGRPREALAQYDGLLALHPEDDVFHADALLARALLLETMGRAADAARDRQAARDIVAASPDWKLRRRL